MLVVLVTPVLVLEYEVAAKYAVFAFGHSIRGTIKSRLCEYMFCPKNNEKVMVYVYLRHLIFVCCMRRV